MMISMLAPLLLGFVPPPPAADGAELKIVTSLSTYAAIARELVGDRGTVISIGQGNENPHYVQPRPSYALELRRADLFVSTGLDLELWVPALLDKANNPKVSDGGLGHVTAYTGVRLADVPSSVSRAGGDVHAFGNPHIWADPINAIVIGRNITTGLKRVSPSDAAYFDQRFAAWRGRVLRALVGEDLVTILGEDVVYNLLDQNKFWDFVAKQQYQGAPLSAKMGGWYRTAAVFRNKEMVCYHKEWDYFSRRFDLPCVAFVEPKPGIPPSPGHVAELIAQIRDQKIPAILSANFYDQGQVKSIAGRTGTVAVIVPVNAGGEPGTDTYVELIDYWVRSLAAAFSHGT